MQCFFSFQGASSKQTRVSMRLLWLYRAFSSRLLAIDGDDNGLKIVQAVGITATKAGDQKQLPCMVVHRTPMITL
uniref:Uncharacterized protein n=1 Tax=Thermosporothrix sp. COM3 TaxID=2490863 RepID=A0A455SGX9_9CHLR|nr:hypothetical protein KTC_13320 [Thermosporothrix sp. COM3]